MNAAKNTEDEVQRVAVNIRAHFIENHLAAESLEGIVRWWLLQQRFEEAWRTVSEALDRLVASGFLRRTHNASGQPIYSMQERQEDEGQ